MSAIFESRQQAGSLLAARLEKLITKNRDNVVILALARGGVPVANEICHAYHLPLEVLIVRKIGHPRQPEYGIGAITEGGYHWLNSEAIDLAKVDTTYVEQIIQRESREIERRIGLYRRGRSLPDLAGKLVILVDDGLATGVTARVASHFVKSQGAAKVVLAVPVCSERNCERINDEVDELLCLERPSGFESVGQFYREFGQLSDADVMKFFPVACRPQKVSEPRNTEPQQDVIIQLGETESRGIVNLPKKLKGFVVFAHGSGSHRMSPRNRSVAEHLANQGIGSLLFDLLTPSETQERDNAFDIPLLAKRLIGATLWVKQQDFSEGVPIGYFGASRGAAAALWAAAELGPQISAVVSRGGRPDLAMNRLPDVTAATLLIVGDLDAEVVGLNRLALSHLSNAHMTLIRGATHLFTEEGTLEKVWEEAAAWFAKYLCGQGESLEQKIVADGSRLRGGRRGDTQHNESRGPI